MKKFQKENQSIEFFANDQTFTNELLGQFIDVVEDFLDDRNVQLESERTLPTREDSCCSSIVCSSFGRTSPTASSNSVHRSISLNSESFSSNLCRTSFAVFSTVFRSLTVRPSIFQMTVPIFEMCAASIESVVAYFKRRRSLVRIPSTMKKSTPESSSEEDQLFKISKNKS